MCVVACATSAATTRYCSYFFGAVGPSPAGTVSPDLMAFVVSDLRSARVLFDLVVGAEAMASGPSPAGTFLAFLVSDLRSARVLPELPAEAALIATVPSPAGVLAAALVSALTSARVGDEAWAKVA